MERIHGHKDRRDTTTTMKDRQFSGANSEPVTPSRDATSYTTYTSFPHFELRSDPAAQEWFDQTSRGILEDWEVTLRRHHASQAEGGQRDDLGAADGQVVMDESAKSGEEMVVQRRNSDGLRAMVWSFLGVLRGDRNDDEQSSEQQKETKLDT